MLIAALKKKNMKKFIALSLGALAFLPNARAQSNQYKIVKTFHIGSSGGWDYLAVDNNKLYVSHGTQVNIVNKNTGDSIGIIENTTGVHGIAFANSLNKGFTSNGRINNVTVFDLTTDKPIGQIATGQNPDAILYDNFSKKIYTCNGRSNDVSVIDPGTEKLVKNISVGGKPETAVSDDAGKIFVNIEDKNEIVVINTKTYVVENRWSLGTAEGPTGLAIDKATKRLFSACDKLLVVMDAVTGKVVAQLPIGDGCDGDVFDPALKNIYTSNGEGTLTVIHENSANDFKVTDNVKTKAGARTIALDEKTHRLFLPTADFEVASPDAAKNERPKMVPGSFQVLVIDK
jgi:YVTN family beta-propeller protein